MKKRIFLLALFVIVFLAGLATLYVLEPKSSQTVQNDAVLNQNVNVENNVTSTENMHSYNAETVTSGCSADDKIFCAIERVVKCTLKPELEDCKEKFVPSFVMGKVEEDGVRPTEISFDITKIKPIADTGDIAVYTKSHCNGSWFGLCEGTVIYSLTRRSNKVWGVSSVYALMD